MKRLFLILAITGILLQNFSNAFILIHYQVNKDYISKNLCENKNKPKMHCNGKCHLKKQLAAQEKKEHSIPFLNLKDKFEIQYFYPASLLKFKHTVIENKFTFVNSSLHLLTSASSIFHPPKA